jgi:hypothetical protein
MEPPKPNIEGPKPGEQTAPRGQQKRKFLENYCLSLTAKAREGML